MPTEARRRKRVSVNVPEHLYRALKAEADAQDVSATAYITLLLQRRRRPIRGGTHDHMPNRPGPDTSVSQQETAPLQGAL